MGLETLAQNNRKDFTWVGEIMIIWESFLVKHLGSLCPVRQSRLVVVSREMKKMEGNGNGSVDMNSKVFDPSTSMQISTLF